MENYDSILLELLQRVQELEKRVRQLEEKENGSQGEIIPVANGMAQRQLNVSPTMKKASMDDIRAYLESLFKKAREEEKTELTIRAGDVEKAVGLTNRVVMVINAMHEYQERYRNEVISTTKSGYSTTVVIKYYLD